VKVDKTLVASVALHVLVIGWGLVSFASKAFESVPEDSLPVEIISPDQLAKVTAGMKTGKKENPKPLVEKVAEAKPPVEDTVGKITEKAPVVTDTAPPPTPVEKPVEKKPDPPKPDPPKPVAENKPKDESKPIEKKPDPPKIDPIAEALKKEEKKPQPKPQTQAATPQPPKPKAERVFDQSKIAALLDKRDPSRQAVTGDALNSNAALGLAHGKAADNSATWGAMFKSQVDRCWKKPYGGIETQMPEAEFNIKLKRDGTLEATPVAVGTPATPFVRAYQESALRAIIDCQPYNLPAAYFDEWKYFAPVFTERPT
jgi:outer membrane biosynthesis protein TonB